MAPDGCLMFSQHYLFGPLCFLCEWFRSDSSLGLTSELTLCLHFSLLCRLTPKGSGICLSLPLCLLYPLKVAFIVSQSWQKNTATFFCRLKDRRFPVVLCVWWRREQSQRVSLDVWKHSSDLILYYIAIVPCLSCTRINDHGADRWFTFQSHFVSGIVSIR